MLPTSLQAPGVPRGQECFHMESVAAGRSYSHRKGGARLREGGMTVEPLCLLSIWLSQWSESLKRFVKWDSDALGLILISSFHSWILLSHARCGALMNEEWEPFCDAQYFWSAWNQTEHNLRCFNRTMDGNWFLSSGCRDEVAKFP